MNSPHHTEELDHGFKVEIYYDDELRRPAHGKIARRHLGRARLQPLEEPKAWLGDDRRDRLQLGRHLPLTRPPRGPNRLLGVPDVRVTIPQKQAGNFRRRHSQASPLQGPGDVASPHSPPGHLADRIHVGHGEPEVQVSDAALTWNRALRDARRGCHRPSRRSRRPERWLRAAACPRLHRSGPGHRGRPRRRDLRRSCYRALSEPS